MTPTLILDLLETVKNVQVLAAFVKVPHLISDSPESHLKLREFTETGSICKCPQFPFLLVTSFLLILLLWLHQLNFTCKILDPMSFLLIKLRLVSVHHWISQSMFWKQVLAYIFSSSTTPNLGLSSSCTVRI